MRQLPYLQLQFRIIIHVQLPILSLEEIHESSIYSVNTSHTLAQRQQIFTHLLQKPNHYLSACSEAEWNVNVEEVKHNSTCLSEERRVQVVSRLCLSFPSCLVVLSLTGHVLSSTRINLSSQNIFTRIWTSITTICKL